MNMKKVILYTFLFIILCSFLLVASTPNQVIPLIEKQLIKKYEILKEGYPETTRDGQWTFARGMNWMTGFLGGELWLMYQMTGNKNLQKMALQHSDWLLEYTNIDYTHDMGFIFYPSCVKSYLMTADKKYQQGAIQASEMLARRYNPKGKFIRAWGKLGNDDRAGLMIIDTMMNLELLFWSAREAGNTDFYDIAYQHALTCQKFSVRSNGSTYHVIEFNPESGEVLKKRTHQGYADESSWARGQAWGIYGFAQTYQNTGNRDFLNTSQILAEYFIQHLPEDFVPTWDLDLKGKTEQRDASAGAIAATGLFLLAELTESRDLTQKYRDYAQKITESLVNKYLFLHSERQVEQGILLHTVYNYNDDRGVDESFPPGDYYFIEALFKYWNLQKERYWTKNRTGRVRMNLNKEWYYLQDNEETYSELSKSGQVWKKVDLPHSWNQWDVTDNLPGYRRDSGWYEKELFIPKSPPDQHYVIHFEGANLVSKVYVNGQYAGAHTGGYVGFNIDISPFIKKGEINIVSVRVDNSYNPELIPSQKSDFFIYGGLTRDVWLNVLPPVYIDQLLISTPLVSKKEATTKLKIRLSTEIHKNSKLFLEVSILDRHGKCLIKKSTELTGSTVDLNLPPIKNPLLWSPTTPHLYTANISLKEGDQVIDTISEKYGYRWFEFAENGPFYLNGERLLLRGTHRHEEYAGYGAAMPDELHRRDMEMIKEMGANFVRLAHYPQDPEIYKACNELGILVWDELPWCRGGLGNKEWKKNTTRLLKEMILQNYNHPSIIIWSLGNEIYWLPDREGGDHIDSLRLFLGELNVLAHQLDPSRMTAVRKFYEGADIVDIFSPSIWAGWYSGVYANYQNALEDARKKYPRFFHAEYGGSSHVGRHVENPISGEGIISPDGWEEEANQIQVKNIAQYGDWSENYIVDLFDWYLHISENLEWFTGNAQWAFKDFGTPLRPENPILYVNQKGLVDRAGNPKDAYYVFRSYWTETPKFCYIESHSWNTRQGPAGTEREINVFSNATAVELFLNGQSLGIKKRSKQKYPAQGLFWQVKFIAGENYLQALGFEHGKTVCRDSIVVKYSYHKSGKPEKIILNHKRLTNGNYLIKATVVDKNNQLCLDYQKKIYFSSDGAGTLLRNYGTPTRSQVIEMANGRAFIEFNPIPGKTAVIEARNQDFKGSYLIINVDE